MVSADFNLNGVETMAIEHWTTAYLTGANASFQRAAREYAEEYTAMAVAAERERYMQEIDRLRADRDLEKKWRKDAEHDREELIVAAIAADRERICLALPSGWSVDPQWVADMVRDGPKFPNPG